MMVPLMEASTFQSTASLAATPLSLDTFVPQDESSAAQTSVPTFDCNPEAESRAAGSAKVRRRAPIPRALARFRDRRAPGAGEGMRFRLSGARFQRRARAWGSRSAYLYPFLSLRWTTVA